MAKKKTQTIIGQEILEGLDIEEEKRAAWEIFRSSVVNFLSAESDTTLDIIDDYNGVLIAIMANQPQLVKQLENALYENKEKITEKDIKLNKSKVAPTIGNWLKYLIKKEGTEMFDNVKITNFVTNTDNARHLSQDEKLLLRKLLLLYRNVKFFPRSLEGIPPEKWELFPVSKTSGELLKARQISGPPKTRSEREIEKLKEESTKYTGGLEKLALEEEMKKKKKIEDLRIEANKYKEGSLERKALEEEISRLEK